MGRRRWVRWGAACVAAGGAMVVLSACEPAGIDLVVTSDGDGGDAVPGDGVCEVTVGAGDCTLRAAIDEANVLPDHETITFSEDVSSLYVFGEGDDTNEVGDLDILDGVTIDGGAAGVAVEGTEADRVFDVHGGDPAPFVNLRNLTIRGGNADDGGGVRLTGPQQTSIGRSLVSQNMAHGAGGGVYVGSGATLSVDQSTFDANGTDGAGAAIWSAGAVSISYSTVAESWSAGAAAIERDAGATGAVNLLVSVVGIQDGSVGCAGAITSLGANVGADGTCGLVAVGDQQSVDPLLGALGDNGGPTDTYLPYQDSPAVDAAAAGTAGCGNPFVADARGVARPQHGDCDAGAVEVEYLPVEIGGGTNYLGTGQDPAGIIALPRHENFWLAVSGPCASVENGDLLTALTDANYYFSGGGATDQNPGPAGGGIQWNRCTGDDAEGTTEANPTYDPNGYFYAIDVPPERAGQALRVDVYDASHCQSSSAGDSQADTASNRQFTTRYRLRAPDGTPLPTDNPLVVGLDLGLSSGTTTGTCATVSSLTSGGYRNGWRQVMSVSAAEAGRYYLQVATEAIAATPEEAVHGSNGFGLRLRFGSAFAECSTDPAQSAIYSASCPRISSVGYASLIGNLAGTYPTLTVGAIPEAAGGGVLQVELWDPAEGDPGIELLDPLSRSVSFDWHVVDRSGSDVAPTGGWSGTVAQPGGVPCATAPPGCNELETLGLDPQGNGRGWNPQPGPYRGSRSKYSDRMVVLTTDLPADLTAEYGAARRLRLRYTAGVAPTDRTTWRAGVWEVGTAPTGP